MTANPSFTKRARYSFPVGQAAEQRKGDLRACASFVPFKVAKPDTLLLDADVAMTPREQTRLLNRIMHHIGQLRRFASVVPGQRQTSREASRNGLHVRLAALGGRTLAAITRGDDVCFVAVLPHVTPKGTQPAHVVTWRTGWENALFEIASPKLVVSRSDCASSPVSTVTRRTLFP